MHREAEFTVNEMATIKNANNKHWQSCGNIRSLRCQWQEDNMVQLLWLRVLAVLKKVKHRNIIWPNHSTHWFLLEKRKKINTYKKTCKRMFTEAFFRAFRSWKQVEYQSTNEQLIHTKEYFLIQPWKRNGVLAHAMAWTNLQSALLRESSQS